jgi:hypothetical protein
MKKPAVSNMMGILRICLGTERRRLLPLIDPQSILSSGISRLAERAWPPADLTSPQSLWAIFPALRLKPAPRNTMMSLLSWMPEVMHQVAPAI